MLTKEKVIGVINQLPSKFSIDDAIEELLLLEKIENGLAQSESNNVFSDEELSKELPKWLS